MDTPLPCARCLPCPAQWSTRSKHATIYPTPPTKALTTNHHRIHTYTYPPKTNTKARWRGRCCGSGAWWRRCPTFPRRRFGTWVSGSLQFMVWWLEVGGLERTVIAWLMGWTLPPLTPITQCTHSNHQKTNSAPAHHPAAGLLPRTAGKQAPKTKRNSNGRK